MSENKDSIATYLGTDFQLKLLWQLVTESSFCEKILPYLEVGYFDDHNFKRFFIVIKEYYDKYKKVPNLQNKSIDHAIKEFQLDNEIDYEQLIGVLKPITNWQEACINGVLMFDGDAVQKQTWHFIKQQEYKKLAGEIIEKLVRNKLDKNVHEIEERIRKIAEVGVEDDDAVEIFDNIEMALRKEFREPIPTGIKVLDEATGGGLGRGEIGIILAPTGAGKAQPLSSKILTPKGWKLMGDIKVNDLIIGSNGLSQKVLGVYPQGVRDIYRINFSDNTSVLCDKEHIWSVNSRKQRTSKSKINGKTFLIPDYTFQQLTVAEMIDTIKTKNGHLNYRLPNLSPVNFDVLDIKLDPYILGAMLADGNMTKFNQANLTTVDDEMVEEFKKRYSNINVHEYNYENRNKIYCISLLNSRKLLEELKLYGTDSSTKFIPEIYKYNSLENRILLLQGLMDTYGTVSKSGLASYSTVSKTLAMDIRELVLSLGGSCKIKTSQKYYKKNNIKIAGKLSYNLNISFPKTFQFDIFRLSRKLINYKKRNKYEHNKFISSIEYSHKEEAQCIYVENSDSLYVTDDYVLTHNTTILTKFANHAFESGKNVLQLIFEDTPDQIRRKHFTIWSEVPLSEIDERTEEVTRIVEKKHNDVQNEFNNKLIIKRFSQENTTLPMIKDYVVRFQKKYGYKFDIIILDYIDCVDSHKKGSDTNADELAIIKSFEAMAAEFNIPCWTAIQTNRSGIESELVYINHMGGNIKRAQKSHFLMSIARTQDQKFHNLANLQILKARFAKDGYVFKDCIFDNNTLKIEGTGDMFKTKSSADDFKKNEPEHFNEKMKKRKTKEEREDILKNVTKAMELQGEINLDSLDDEPHDNDKFQEKLQKLREESLKNQNSDEKDKKSE